MENVEKSLLSCLIKKGDLIKEIALTEEHFEKLEYKKVFTAMKTLESKDIPIDIVSVKIQLGQDLLLFGGSQLLSDIYNDIVEIKNIKSYEKHILNDFKIRKTKELTQQLQEIHSSRDIDQLNTVIQEVNEVIEQSVTEKDFDMLELLYEVNEDVEAIKEGVNGIPTGFAELDNILDGLDEEELIIIAARPSVGKTAFALAITQNACNQNEFVDFFTLEMSDKVLISRMLCSIGQINTVKFKNAQKRFNSDDWTRYTYAQGVLSKYKDNLHIYDYSKITVSEIRAKVSQSMRKHPNKRHVAIIDYLTLIEGNGRKERHLEVGEITRNLKRMAKDLKIPVVLLAQLNRGVEQRQNKVPMLSDLRDSGEIEQDANKVMFLYRDDYYNKDTESKNIIDVIVAKSRNGALGTVQLAFFKDIQRFENLERRYGNN